jgi:hypothetical protein
MRMTGMPGMSPDEEYGKSPLHEGEKNGGNVSTLIIWEVSLT